MGSRQRAARAGIVAAVVVSFASAFAGAAHAQFPKVDPMSPASCDVQDGWMTVYSQALKGWDDATKDGRLSDAKSTDIAVWLVAQQNRIVETNDIKGVCLDTIAKRKAEGF